jgi:hypothetical protein
MFTWLPRLDAEGADAPEGHPGEFVVLLSPSDADPTAAVRNPASIPDRAPDLIWRYRLWPERGFEYVSPSTTTLLGYPPMRSTSTSTSCTCWPPR